MNWLEIQEKLNQLNGKYLELENDKLFLEKEENYETKNQKINIALFYLVKAIKNKIKKLPLSDELVRQQIMNLGNDIDKVNNFLGKLSNDFELYETGMEVVRTLIVLSDKDYEFKDGYENSLVYKHRMDFTEKTIEMMDRDDLTIEEKYDYIDSFDKNLPDEDKGELHVQALIGKDENHMVEMKMAQILFSAFKGDIRKIDDYHQLTLEVGAVAENRIDEEPLEEQLKYYNQILISPYVKNMKQDSKNK